MDVLGMVQALGVLLVFLWMCIAWGGDIVFVVRKDVGVDTLSKKEIRKLFLRDKDFIDGITAVPVNLPPSDPLRKKVEKEILDMDEEELQLFWNRKYLNGIDPPIVLTSQVAVKVFVKKIKGAIGYIDESYLDDELKVVFRLKR